MGDKPELVGGNMRFTQEADSCDNDSLQILHVEVEDSGAGKYLWLKTDRWAFDKPEELLAIIKQVSDAFGVAPPVALGEENQ